MAWRANNVKQLRKEFILKVQTGKKTVADLCREYNISRKTGYKWINRVAEGGEATLEDRSRAPHSQPSKTDESQIQEILQIKHKYPKWGPKKILAVLEEKKPEQDWPSDTTVGNILWKHGLVKPRKLRQKMPAKTSPLSHCQAPNDVWTVDFKGWFLAKDGTKCEPLTVCDAHTRFILHCGMLPQNREADVWKVLERLFYENGLPVHLRHDNGPPFATIGAGRLSRLSVKLIKAGVAPEWIDPGKPYQNGRHERMHRTLKEEGIDLGLPFEEQTMRFGEYTRYFNYERPHEALGQKCPGTLYVPSGRVWDGKFRSPEYDSDCLVKRINKRGQLYWNGIDVYIGKTLGGEFVAFKEEDNGKWGVYFGSVYLGTIDTEGYFEKPVRNNRFKRAYKERCY